MGYISTRKLFKGRFVGSLITVTVACRWQICYSNAQLNRILLMVVESEAQTCFVVK